MTLSQGIIKKWLLPFILCFLMIFAFFPQSKAEAASERHVYLSIGEYSDGTAGYPIYVPTNGKYSFFFGVNSISYHSVKVQIKKNGSFVVAEKIIKPGDGWGNVYSANPGGYYTIHLDCNPYGASRTCKAEGHIKNVN
ncbi:hypothetical protein BACCIP111899_03023 [Bacillus rhizoplanae]|uniref:Uncharacterized protein n=1 Tax=Bacillus rhizoplanae TaxID=2880966 RepID=A0ABM8YDC1_9BACI|nr:hypothetical protein [Bacillus rhizoplanae]CAG9613804.1 hypothetical protein BACCIP111899_03023 [Bacillus rhizoplanae]